MNQIQIGGLVCVGVFVMGAVMATTALAGLPEFELERNFGSLSREAAVIEASSGAKVTCPKSYILSVAQFLKNKIATTITMFLTGCESEGNKCTSPTLLEGEIAFKNLEGELGYLPGTGKGADPVAFAIKPKTGTTISEFKCVNEDLVEGCVVGTLTPVAMLVGEFTLLFEENGVGTQLYLKYRSEEGLEETACKMTITIGAGEALTAGFKTEHTLIVNCPNMNKEKIVS